jgi:hypothetical protein
LERAEKRREAIPALGRVVRKKSTAAMEEYWRRNRGKSDAEREPYPHARDFAEQREMEQIGEDFTAALNGVALVQATLPAALPIATNSEAGSLIRKLLRRQSTASHRDLIALVERIIVLLRDRPAQKRGRGAPTKFPPERRERALAMKLEGHTNGECAAVLYDTKRPSSQQTKNFSKIFAYYRNPSRTKS